MGVGVKTNEMEVVDMLKHFGTFEDTFQVRETRYYEHADMSKLTMKEKMLKAVKDGDREVQMFISLAIPSFCLLENGRRVRVRYPAQPVPGAIKVFAAARAAATLPSVRRMAGSRSSCPTSGSSSSRTRHGNTRLFVSIFVKFHNKCRFIFCEYGCMGEQRK